MPSIADCMNIILAISTLALAVATFFMVREMYITRKEERRPYVVADISYDDIRGFINVQNIGRIAAQDVKVSFEPSVTKYLAPHYFSYNPFNNTIRTIPPGGIRRVELINKIDAWSNPLQEVTMPVDFKIKVEYKWSQNGKTMEVFDVDLKYDRAIGNPSYKPQPWTYNGTKEVL